MEVARNLLSPPPSFLSRTHLKNSIPFPSSVLMFPEQGAPAVTSIPVTSVTRLFPTSVILQEQREEHRPLLHNFKDDRLSQGIVDKSQKEAGVSASEENAYGNLDQSDGIYEQQLPRWSDLEHMLSITEEKEDPFNAVALAKKALLASKEAASLANGVKSRVLELDDSLPTSLGSGNLCELALEEEEAVAVRSTRRLERKSKKRRVPKPNLDDIPISKRIGVLRKRSGTSDPVKIFLSGPGTMKLLTSKEECELSVQIQDFLRLKEVKSKLQSQFGREPTIAEWADAVGVTSQVLQSELLAGDCSRQKLINSNLRLVVFVAKRYKDRGLGLPDLLVEGTFGLMKSVDKFKPQSGCRFATYAFWSIRQNIQKAVYKHSRTIRIPVNVYTLLGKLSAAKKTCAKEGIDSPPREELARRVGITVDKLEQVMAHTKSPVSLQQPIWADQKTTLQDIIADPMVETVETSVEKDFMRQHVRNLLRELSPRERKIVSLRFGLGEGKRITQAEVAKKVGLPCSLVRELERRAMNKLKQHCHNKDRGFDTYVKLLL